MENKKTAPFLRIKTLVPESQPFSDDFTNQKPDEFEGLNQ